MKDVDIYVLQWGCVGKMTNCMCNHVIIRVGLVVYWKRRSEYQPLLHCHNIVYDYQLKAKYG